MNKYRLLLFDIDDTLLSSSWFNEGLKKTIKIHPLTQKLDEKVFLEKMLNVSMSLLEQFKKRELTPLEFRRERWSQSFAYFDVATNRELLDDMDELFLRTSMDCITVNKKVIDLLNDLKSHYQLGIVTNGLYDPRFKIRQMQLSEIFTDETIFDAEKLGYRKPDPEIYLTALKHFDNKPEETIFIGDSWIHDIVGPMEVGIEAIWINKKGHRKSTTHNPIAIVSDLMKIKSILIKD